MYDHCILCVTNYSLMCAYARKLLLCRPRLWMTFLDVFISLIFVGCPKEFVFHKERNPNRNGPIRGKFLVKLYVPNLIGRGNYRLRTVCQFVGSPAGLYVRLRLPVCPQSLIWSLTFDLYNIQCYIWYTLDRNQTLSGDTSSSTTLWPWPCDPGLHHDNTTGGMTFRKHILFKQDVKQLKTRFHWK